MIPAPSMVSQVYEKHKATWTEEEKFLVHKKLNQHGIGDGISVDDQAITELMCMIYVDGIRDGRR